MDALLNASAGGFSFLTDWTLGDCLMASLGTGNTYPGRRAFRRFANRVRRNDGFGRLEAGLRLGESAMSYDVVIWLPLVVFACVGGVVLIKTGRPLAGVVVAGLVAAAFLIKLWGMPAEAYAWSSSRVSPPLSGWFLQHVTADGVHKRARWSFELLLWTVPALLVSGWGAVAAARKRRAIAPLGLLVPAAFPTGVLVAWVLVAPFYWSADDPRWQMGYLDEWRAAGLDADDGAPCFGFLTVQNRLTGLVPDDAIARARSDCRSVCEFQGARGSFNPGVLNDVCGR